MVMCLIANQKIMVQLHFYAYESNLTGRISTCDVESVGSSPVSHLLYFLTFN